jgi:hypothetical protein
MWDGIWEDVWQLLLTKWEMGDGKPQSYRKSRVAGLSWDTGHDKFVRVV